MTESSKQTTPGTPCSQLETHGDHQHFFKTRFLGLTAGAAGLGGGVESLPMLTQGCNLPITCNLHHTEEVFYLSGAFLFWRILIGRENLHKHIKKVPLGALATGYSLSALRRQSFQLAPVLAGFGGLRGMPLWLLSTSSG